MRGQVGFVDQSAGVARVVGNGFGQLAPVEVVALAGGNTLQGARLTRANELLTRQRCASVGGEGFAVAGLRQQLCHLRLPLPVHGGRHHVAVAGVTQRRLEQFGKRHTAEAV